MEDNKRIAVADLLSIVVIMVYQRLSVDRRRVELQEQVAQQMSAAPANVSIQPVQAGAGATTAPQIAVQPNAAAPLAAGQTTPPTAAELSKAPHITITTPRVETVIN